MARGGTAWPGPLPDLRAPARSCHRLSVAFGAPCGSQPLCPQDAPGHEIRVTVGEDTQHQLLGAPADGNNWPVGDKVTAAAHTLDQVQLSEPRTSPRPSGNRAVCFSHDPQDGASKTSLILSK